MTEIKNFFLHLRLSYNFLILSAPFFLGAIYNFKISDITLFIYGFLLIYILLFGGANAYNSYIDKDEGPIGGLEHPPKMSIWMYWASWSMQIIGFYFSFKINLNFAILFGLSMALFWIYSGTYFRFKSKPILSFFVIGIGTVINIVLMGYFAAGGTSIFMELFLGALGATLVVLSMYPFSQAYQMDEDKKRGDTTFAVKYGLSGIKNNYWILFNAGIILLIYSLRSNIWLSVAMLVIGLGAGFLIWQVVKKISGKSEEYKIVMRTKYYSGITFTLLMLGLLIWIA